jgi:MerR family transcriptional regulator, light-induced transcriptional regulator
MSGEHKSWAQKADVSTRETDQADMGQNTENSDTSLLWPRSSPTSYDESNFGAESSADRERASNQREFQAREENRLLKEEQKSAKLARAIEAEIIPRLLIAHISARTTKALVESVPAIKVDSFSAKKIAEFSTIILNQSVNQAVTYIDALLDHGMSTETMILEVLSPSARYLGDLWTEDKVTFVDVTLGLSRLQQLLRIYGPTFEVEFAKAQTGQKILLAAMPGEQHTFGMSVVEEFFRRDGWDVHSILDVTRKQLLQRVKDEWFDVVGLSASGDASIELLAPLITALRESAVNRKMKVIVGGCQFLAEPANAIALGADMVACNGREAVLNVERLLNPAGLQ